MDFKKLAAQYKSELLDNVLPFWLEKSQDHEFGGYFTCLDRDGSVFDTDKFVWLQGSLGMAQTRVANRRMKADWSVFRDVMAATFGVKDEGRKTWKGNA